MAEEQPLQPLLRETYREKATRKFKENPWVPLGVLATCGALTMAMVKMRRGDSRSFNHWLRVRVVAQGLTVAAMVLGTYTLGTRNTEAHKTQTEADRLRRIEEKREKEKDEFAMRLREAEEAHKMEEAITQGKLPGLLKNNGAEGQETGPSNPAPSSAKSSWWKWFGK